MEHNLEHCLHEDQISNHSRKIAELETKADYKEKRIDELNNKMERLNVKIDELNENVNTLILQSTKGDTQLDNRLIAIETELELQKQANKDNLERYRLWLAIATVALTVLTLYLNYFN